MNSRINRDLDRLNRTISMVRDSLSTVRDEINLSTHEIELLREIDTYILDSEIPASNGPRQSIEQIFQYVIKYINKYIIREAECAFYINLDSEFCLLLSGNSDAFPQSIDCREFSLDWREIERNPLHVPPSGVPFTTIFCSATEIYTEPLFIFDGHLLGVFVVQGFSGHDDSARRWLHEEEHIDTLRGIFRQLKIAYRFVVEHRRASSLNELWSDFSERYFTPTACLNLLAARIIQMQPDFGPLSFKSYPEVQILFLYGDALRILATTGSERDIETVPIFDSVSGLAFTEGCVLNIDPRASLYANKYKRYFGGMGDIRSELVIPMYVRSEIVGVVNFESREEKAFFKTLELTLIEVVKKITPVALSLKARLDHNRDAQSAYSAIMSDYLRRFSGVLRHELASPTSALKTSIETALLRIDHQAVKIDDIVEDLNNADSSRKQISRSIFDFIDDLSNYGEVEPACLNEIVNETIEIVNDTYKSGIGIDSTQDKNFDIKLREKGFFRVNVSRLLKPYLLCLFDNSIRSINDKKKLGLIKTRGAIVVTIEQDADNVDMINLIIRDNGMGASRSELKELKRFRLGTRFRGDRGQGYGLAATQRYLTEVGGWIDIDAEKGRKFVVKLSLKHER